MTAADVGQAAAYGLFAVMSVVLGVVDVRTHRLPNAIVLAAYPVATVLLATSCAFGESWARLGSALLGGAALFVFYLVLRVASPRGMGGGDVKLAGVIGILLAWTGIDALVVGTMAGFVLGGLYGAILLAVRRADARTAIPFGPWMLAGAWIGLAAGPALTTWVLSTRA